MSLQNRKNEYNRLISEGREVPEVLKKEFGEVPAPKEPKPEQPKKKKGKK